MKNSTRKVYGIGLLFFATASLASAQSLDEIAKLLPAPKVDVDIATRLCVQTSGKWGYELGTPNVLIDRYLSAHGPELLAAWGRLHFAPGRTETDCPIVNQPLLIGRWSESAGKPNAFNMIFSQAALAALLEARDSVVRQAALKASSKPPCDREIEAEIESLAPARLHNRPIASFATSDLSPFLLNITAGVRNLAAAKADLLRGDLERATEGDRECMQKKITAFANLKARLTQRELLIQHEMSARR